MKRGDHRGGLTSFAQMAGLHIVVYKGCKVKEGKTGRKESASCEVESSRQQTDTSISSRSIVARVAHTVVSCY